MSVRDFLRAVGIDDLDAFDAAAKWAATATATDRRRLTIPLGHRVCGDQVIDELWHLSLSDGPDAHLAVSGRTGSGRSTLLRAMALSLAACYGPDRVGLAFVDLFGGATFAGMENLPHVRDGRAPRAVRDLLDWLDAELRMRERYGVRTDLVVFIDETVHLSVPEQSVETLSAFSELAKRASWLGVHLVWGSESHTRAGTRGALDNFGSRCVLSVSDRQCALDMVGVDDPFTAPVGQLCGWFRSAGPWTARQLVMLNANAPLHAAVRDDGVAAPSQGDALLQRLVCAAPYQPRFTVAR
ncbi:MAG: FtsK/SpoIIIE domain-containing protein [Gordonia amarae]